MDGRIGIRNVRMDGMNGDENEENEDEDEDGVVMMMS